MCAIREKLNEISIPKNLSLKLYLLTSILILHSVSIFCQDGSNILYVKVDSLHKYFNKTIQVDFKRLSRGTHVLDTVSLAFKGVSIKFIEHRQDNGYNNWFFQQYLESLDSIGRFHLRLIKSTLTAIKRDEISVINYFNFYDEHGNSLLDVPIEDPNSYRKQSIIEVLVLAE